MKNILILAAITIVFFAGCSNRIVDFTVISSKNHNLNFNKAVGIECEGSSYGFLGVGANIKEAMDRALQSAGKNYDLLVDGVILQRSYFIVHGYTVTGLAVNSSILRASLGEKGFEEWCKTHEIFVIDEKNIQNIAN